MPETSINDSILKSVAKICGCEDNYFNPDLIIHTNMGLSYVTQLGAGTRGFMVTDDTQTWDEFLGSANDPCKSAVITYVTMYAKKAFDPPTTGFGNSAIGEIIKEAETRILYECDPRSALNNQG